MPARLTVERRSGTARARRRLRAAQNRSTAGRSSASPLGASDRAPRDVAIHRQARHAARRAATRVGEATCAVNPWPHQIRAFDRLYAMDWLRACSLPTKSASERRSRPGCCSGRCGSRVGRRRILDPHAGRGDARSGRWSFARSSISTGPMYDDGCLTLVSSRRPRAASSTSGRSRDRRGISEPVSHRVEPSHAPAVIGEKELCDDAEPWDLMVLDEAHHARRKGAGSVAEEGPNALLRLMRAPARSARRVWSSSPRRRCRCIRSSSGTCSTCSVFRPTGVRAPFCGSSS